MNRASRHTMPDQICFFEIPVIHSLQLLDKEVDFFPALKKLWSKDREKHFSRLANKENLLGFCFMKLFVCECKPLIMLMMSSLGRYIWDKLGDKQGTKEFVVI
ncbi:hypothetical protein M5K25_018384 [Dendrobium thyrsiflorum]|uniref:Uncharacterized protein n=1 Tax=Dendrobium thyrsiflorum TaxID=117978 RepID=A0ABD0UII1_DENTH